jgi:catechol 2,3-dioxygenase-like lactoylglutathione lyase family enzyme
MPTARAALVNDPSSTTAMKHVSWRMFIGGAYRCDAEERDLTYEPGSRRLPGVRALRINHVSIGAKNLEKSTQFYEDVFSMERIPTPTFDLPVQWLRVGDMQLHLFLDESPQTGRHHLGLTIDDFDAAYQAVKSRASDMLGFHLVELPSGQVQLYFRDPSDNLIELNWPDVNTLDRSRYPELHRVAEHIPQKPDAEHAVLYLNGGD